MKTKLTLQVVTERDELKYAQWYDAFPAAGKEPKKAPDQKDDDPTWKAALAEFEAKKALHARAVAATGSQVAYAAKYCELMGMSIGHGDTAPLVYETKLESEDPAEIAKRIAEMKQWVIKTVIDAKTTYLRMSPAHDFMKAELEAKQLP